MDKSTLSTMTHRERYLHKVIALVMKKAGINCIVFNENEISSKILDGFNIQTLHRRNKPDIIKFYFKEVV